METAERQKQKALFKITSLLLETVLYIYLLKPYFALTKDSLFPSDEHLPRTERSPLPPHHRQGVWGTALP